MPKKRLTKAARNAYVLNYTVGNVSKRTGEPRDKVKKWLLSTAKKASSCPFCGTSISIGKYAVDHKEAINRGGSLLLSNCHLTCQPCNRAKGNLNEGEFHALMGFLNSQNADMKKIVLARLKIAGILYKGK